MGPIDYSAAIVNPLQSVLQGFQLGSQLRAQQDARAKERAAAEREKAFMQDISALPTSATGSQDFLRIASKYPDKFEMTSKFWGALNEQRRGYLLDTGAAALRTLTPKADGSYDTDATVATLEERAIAAENSGDKESAKQIRDIASVVKINPAAARATIGMTMIQADKDRGKAIVDAAFGNLGPIDTSTVKNLIAEGFTPGTPEFKQAMNEERRKITVTLPGGGFFSGSPDKLREILGEVPAGAQRGSLPRVTDKKSYDAVPPGASYTDPNGIVRVKPGVKGGPASSAPGSFRAGS